MDVETVSRLWRALGFVDPEPGSPNFTFSDSAALRVVSELLAAGYVTEELTETVARAMGQSLSRLAAAQVEVTADLLDREPGLLALAAGDQSVFVAAVIQRSQRTIQKVRLDPRSRPFGPRRPRRSLRGHRVQRGRRRGRPRGQDARRRGDVDLRQRPGRGRIALELAEVFGRDNPVPPVRVGVAYGPALARAGDVLGPVVNLASRCTTLARPGAEPDKALADALEQAGPDNPEEVGTTRPRRAGTPLRRIGRISTFRLRWAKKADGNGPGRLTVTT